MPGILRGPLDFRVGLFVRFVTCFSAALVVIPITYYGYINLPLGPLIGLLLFGAFVNIPYLLLAHRFGRPRLQSHLRVVVDTVIVTLAIHFLGGVEVPLLVFLYTVAILYTGTMLSTRAAYILANLSGAQYALLLWLEYHDIIPKAHIFDVNYTAKEQISMVILAVFFMNLIAYCTAYFIRLIEARSEELAEAKKRVDEVNEQLHALAITDGLTDLYNRRFFEQMLDQEVKRARRFHHPLSLIMLDIDDFKHYNDSFGHPEGDWVLRRIAELLKGSMRDIDLACRYGGEEFSVLLPETPKPFALVVAEKIHKIIEKYPFPNEENQPHGSLTICLGIGTFPDEVETAEGLVALADRRLYEAKRLGKNRLVG